MSDKDTDRKPLENTGDLFRLTNIRPKEVSIVDVPANLQPFTVVKNDRGDADMADQAQIVTNPDGTLTIATEKQKGRFSGDTRTAAEKLISLANQAKEGDVTPDMAKELGGIVTALQSLQQAQPKSTAKADDVEKQANAHRVLLDEKTAGLTAAVGKVSAMMINGASTSDMTEATGNLADLAWSFGSDIRDYATMVAKSMGQEHVDSMEAAKTIAKSVEETLTKAKEQDTMAEDTKPAVARFTAAKKKAAKAALKTLMDVFAAIGMAPGEDAKKALEGIEAAVDKAETIVEEPASTDTPEAAPTPEVDTAKADMEKALKDRDETISDLSKRLDTLEKSGVSTALNDDGATPDEKDVTKSLWGGCLRLNK